MFFLSQMVTQEYNCSHTAGLDRETIFHRGYEYANSD